MNCGSSVGRPASVSAIPTTEICQTVTLNIETKEMDSVKPTISFDSRPAYTEYTRSVLEQLDEKICTQGTPPHS